MLEKNIERNVCKYAKSKGILTYKFTSPGTRGVCDQLCIYRGRAFFIEFKAPGKKPAPLQDRHHQVLIRAGMDVYVVDSVQIGRKVIDYEHQGERFNGARVRDVNSDRERHTKP